MVGFDDRHDQLDNGVVGVEDTVLLAFLQGEIAEAEDSAGLRPALAHNRSAAAYRRLPTSALTKGVLLLVLIGHSVPWHRLCALL